MKETCANHIENKEKILSHFKSLKCRKVKKINDFLISFIGAVENETPYTFFFVITMSFQYEAIYHIKRLCKLHRFILYN